MNCVTTHLCRALQCLAVVKETICCLSLFRELQGLAHAKCQNLLDFRTFDLDDYEVHERVENGDSTWIVPGNLQSSHVGYLHHTLSLEALLIVS